MGGILLKEAKKVYKTYSRDKVVESVEEMKENPYNPDTQRERCDVLWAMVTNRLSDAYNRRSHRRIAAVGGVQVVMDVLKNHNQDLALRAACRLLAELALDRVNSEAMRVGNAQERLEKCAKELYDDEYVTADVRRALKNMQQTGAHLEHDHIKARRGDRLVCINK